ncbi:MAG: hemolysin family protein [Actinomycetes bacterium]
MIARHAWLIGITVLLVVIAGLAAAGEAALARVSRARAEELVREGAPGAPRLLSVVADSASYVNLLTLLRVVCEVLSTAFVTVVCLDALPGRAQAVLVAAVVMVLVSFVAVGVSPRTLGRQHAERVGTFTARLVYPLARVLGPLPRLLILLGNALTPGRGLRQGPFATEAELRELVDLAQENRVIEPAERAMIHSVFELGDTLVREVMVPRTDMVFVERTKTLRQATSLALRSGYSRIPVIGDGEDDVLGIVYLKDLARRTYEHRDAESAERVESVMRPAAFVPESKDAASLLREMQTDNVHIAIVVDEYGGTAGLVTIEDILEEIVGEITDEYDAAAPVLVEHLHEGQLRVSTRLHLDELSELVRVDLLDEDVDTIGGLMAKHLGRVPIPGAEVDVAGVHLVAETGQGRRNRLSTILVTPPRTAEREGNGADDTETERVDA